MEEIYYVIGFIMFWAIMAVLLMIIVYGLLIFYKLLLLIFKNDFWTYYVFRSSILSTTLISIYDTHYEHMSSKRKKYLLKFRLRNIKRANRSIN